MAYKYNTRAEVIEATNDERCISRDDVHPRVLRAKVWQVMVSLPGCLPHYSGLHTSERAARSDLAEYRRNCDARERRAYVFEAAPMNVSDLF